MNREQMIEAVLEVLPEEITTEDIVCIMMSIVGNYSDCHQEAGETIGVFGEAALVELMQGDGGYFGRDQHAKH